MSEQTYIETASGWRSVETYRTLTDAYHAARERSGEEGTPFEPVAVEPEQLDGDTRYAISTQYRPGSRRPGRPRIHREPRQDVRLALPVDLIAAIDAAADNRTAFIEAAVRERLERLGREG